MSSSKNWSHNSFEDAMKKFVPFIKLWWMEYMNIIPVNYSEWSDTIYVIVEFELTNEGLEMTRGWNSFEQQEVTALITEYLRKSFKGYLNTNILIQKFKMRENYVETL